MEEQNVGHYRKLERMYLSAPINGFFRPTIEIERGRAVITNPIRRELFHAAGAVHGSTYFKVLDDAAWFAVNSLVTDVFVLTTTFTTYLTRPVTSGTLTAIGEVANEGRTQWLAQAVVYDDEDREVGRGSGTFVKSRSPLTPEIGYA
ncbi:MAG: PaaI family thioesterase [Actinomycetota bacterium]|nr:PaaI family thioesterase [Actinomycetota bacterium]